jgi:membrane protein implicated in regulation of membrane protease activity
MEKSIFFQLGLWNWFIIAAVFGLLEVILPGYFMIWYGLAAVFVGVLALMVDISWQMQLVLYAVIGMSLLIASIRFAGSRTGESDRPMLNKRGKSHIGKTYQLLDATRNGRGSVKVGDSIWAVQLENKADLDKGAGVLITDVIGTRLIGKAA